MNKTSVNKGQCGCGAVKIKLTLPNTLGDYAARACDCDYCIERNVAYVSDPTGSLEITSDENLKVDQHGSEQAKFLSCKHCNEMIAVTYEFDDLVKGAANANLLSEVDTMKQAEVVSPKLLSATEKVTRWRKLWLDVTVK